jgi:hypothetical protein
VTPELIAELRDWFPFDGSLGGYSCSYMPTPKGPYDTLPDRWHEMLDEIERLRQLVRDAHAWPLGQTVELHAWTDCSCGHDLGPERGYDEMSLMHLAHIEELLNGVTE